MDLQTCANCLALFIAADIPVMMHGSPGIGKSDIGRAVYRALGYDYWIDRRASQMEPVDAIGVPSIVNGRTTWNPPSWLPSDATHAGKRGIVFFDELPDSPLATQSALYQLILDRHLAGLDMPAGLRFMAAGNLTSDKAAAKKISSALGNRFAHLFPVPTTESFAQFALHGATIQIRPDVVAFTPQAGIDSRIVAFLRWYESRHGNTDALHNMKGDLLAFPTPRSIAQVSKILPCPDDLKHFAIKALVGSAWASEFMGFLKFYGTLPTWADIFAAPDSCPVPSDLSARYALACGIARHIDSGNIDRAITYLQRMNPGFASMAVNDAIGRDASLKLTAGYVSYAIATQALKL